ncbi:unnamed protein product [Didymodactylos carnosus]|uniref:Uncharacterized protein n=1 Tax=Didymodactylos carnosus TaxID=1234261 RepID=A0A813UBA6_9BILA|nr:unnamed protein product [Didymodactylos carnosus]CAF0823481.1 unnamed protein product [Didymodactylos carnosus]CAF3607382.1 unnamed protein product [Didymodactylos carnosus]CAF3610097.1 unnamed protein product [Didymodactylos carnosus]
MNMNKYTRASDIATIVFGSLLLMHELALALVPGPSQTPRNSHFKAFYYCEEFDGGCFLEHLVCETFLDRRSSQMYLLDQSGMRTFINDDYIDKIHPDKSFDLLQELSKLKAGDSMPLFKLEPSASHGNDVNVE